MFYFFLFVFGLFVGSFINVITLRYQPGNKLLSQEVIAGRSRCPHCFQKLNWYELAPIFSFLIQKGKCRHCGGKISLQYPIVEILSGLIFIGVYWRIINLDYSLLLTHYLSLITFIWILIFLLFLLFSIIDIRHYIIPDQINLSLAVSGLILIIIQSFNFSISQSSFLGHYSLLFGSFESIWVNRFVAVLTAMFMFGAIIIITRGKAMGWGDFKLAGALGLIFGWPDIIIVVALSFIIGAIFIIPLLIKGTKKMKDVVPFGPFLAIAAVLVFLFGFQIIKGYFEIFGIIF